MSLKNLVSRFIVFCSPIFLGTLLFMPTEILAEKITELKVQTSDSNLLLTWKALSPDTLKGKQGYAIQWGDGASDIHIEKPVRLYSNSNGTNIRLKTFEAGKYYYLRVYAYTRDFDNNLVLSDGSQMIQWRYKATGFVESELSDVVDPVIVQNTTSKNSSSTTPTITHFGKIRTQVYDNFADIFWSRPNGLASSEYDGFRIEVSKKNDFSQLDIDALLSRGEHSARLKNLSPKTDYFIRGSFYKNKGTGTPFYFGIGEIRESQTLASIDRSAYNRVSRNIKRIEKKPMYSLFVGATQDKNATTTVKTVQKTTPSKNASNNNSTAKKARIKAIKEQIKKLQAEMNRLESDLGIKKTIVSKTPLIQKRTKLSKTELRKRLLERLRSRRK